MENAGQGRGVGIAKEQVLPSSSSRSATFDIVKGIGIIEVMTHHLLSHSARKYSVEGRWDWWAMMIAHKVLHFAVPTFLLISAILLAKSLLKHERPDWKRFYARRVQRSLLPYVCWTVIYLLFRLKFAHNDAELDPITVNLPLLGIKTLPRMLTERELWVSGFLWGKTFYHLYFLVVLLQFSLVFGIVFPIMRRSRLSFNQVFLLAFLLQLLAFWLNAIFLYPVLHFTTPASSILWYIPAFVIGTWLGIQWSEWGEIWKKYSRHFACAVILGLFGYLCLDLAAIRNPNINSYAYNMSLTLFTTTIALWLIGAVQRLEKRPIGRVLQRVGNWSLPLFLTHPMALYFLSGPRLSKIWERVPLQFALIGVLMFLVSWCVSVIIMRLKLDRLLLGRSLASQDGN